MKNNEDRSGWLQSGFLDLAAYAKYLFEEGRQNDWNPFPEQSLEEIKNRCSFSVNISGGQGRAGEEWERLSLLKELFDLNEEEIYMLYMAGLTKADDGFYAAYRALGSRSGEAECHILERVWAYCHNKEPKKVSVRWSFLRRFFFRKHTLSNELILEDRIVQFLLQETPTEITFNMSLMKEASGNMPFLEDDVAGKLFQYLQEGKKSEEKECIVISGPDGVGKRECVRRAAKAVCSSVIFIKEQKLREMPEEDRDALLREAVLSHFCLCVELDCEDISEIRSFCEDALKLTTVLFFVGEENRELLLSVPALEIYIGFPDMAKSSRIWKQVLSEYPAEQELDVQSLSNQYRLSYGQIRRIAELAWKQVRYGGKAQLSLMDLQEACHRLLRNEFGNLAVQIKRGGSWDDLILPERQKRRLREVFYQLKYRHKVLEEWGLKKQMPYGTGVSVIFSGPPGTGKTMAAGIMAGELGVELYRVCLPAVVSKYIGETEKNLEQIFERADKSQAALFFDEADVLFGRRTEVKEANDKYSNLEAAFLLQKIEEFEGLTILATNLLKNMDEAFRRRMKLIVEFPFPGKAERFEIWKHSIPSAMPSEELDFRFLAERFELSGSGIRNVVYQAAFQAAAAGQPITMGMLMRAVADEYEKNGKVLSKQEAGIYGMDVEEFR